MIKDNLFFLPNIKNIIIFGYSDQIDEINKINNKFNIKTNLIISSEQSKNKKIKINYKIFDYFDKRLKDFIKTNFDINSTLFISLGCRYIFNKDDIKYFFNQNLINFHGSRLPLDSGGGHWSWKILRGEKIDNQLVHLISEKIDNGPIIDFESSIFPHRCKIPLDYDNYAKNKFLNFYEKFIKNLCNKKKFNLKFQPDYLGAYYPRLNTDLNGWINWNLKSYQIERFINAFDDPYSGSLTYIRNKKVRLKKTYLSSSDVNNHPFMSGLILRHDKNWIVVGSNDQNVFLIKEVLDEKGLNILSKLKVGDRFYTPIKKLDDSKKYRVYYKSNKLVKKKIF